MKHTILKGQHYINGEFIAGKGSEHFTSIDPTYGTLLSENKSATAAEVHLAVESAALAFQTWKKFTLDERIVLIKRYGVALEANRQSLAEAIAFETGKVLWEASLEITSMIAKIEASIKAYQARTGLEIQGTEQDRRVLRHRPHGVIAIFGPFNFPGHLPGSHMIPALLAGNTVVFKPSEYCPYFSHLMFSCWHQAGLPKGVVNMVLGESQTGRALSEHPLIQGLFFTGSVRVGRILHQQWAGHPEKLLVLEMGGNNPLIIWDVKNLDAAAYYTIQSAYLTAGQRCVCARRLIIPQGKAGDQIITALLDRIARIQVGPFDQKQPEPFMGGLISRKAATEVLQKQEKLIQKNGKPLILCTMIDPISSLLRPGLIDVTHVENRVDEEIFGPLLQVIRVQNFDDAITEANSTAYGLASGILSDRSDLYAQFLAESRAGVVNWNKQTTGASALLPFGGIGLSGNHRPSAFYAADYSAYPVASMEADALVLPQVLSPGL